ncbi:MAG: response regulator transcription factor [Pseudomonadota bacterium]
MRIAVIEDNLSLAKAIAYRLRDRGHAVDLLHDGTAADAFLVKEGADLVVLDINLPGRNGLDILHAMRDRGDASPVILLTARGLTEERVAGLDAGADDYLVKPFEMDELEARIRALSRRKNLDYAAVEHIGDLTFDRGARVLLAGREALDLRRRELAVFECLLDSRARIVPRDRLLDQVYGVGADVEAHAIEPHVSRLRRRLAGHRVVIKTVRGLGYLLDEAP